ncbi:SH3 domain-containing protein [Marivita sp.]|uniref:SH3 domain-containing protein n=1 Tax=Marivita sp. TaxID=2003365 RepID=UPI002635263F|nr:SH3 domain-containing protein [Marivita sp.]
MNRYILIAFAVMAMAFYELSGGADFEPGDTSLVIFAEPKPIVTKPEPRPEVVARANTRAAELTDIAPTRALIEPVATNPASVVTPVSLTTQATEDSVVSQNVPQPTAVVNDTVAPIPQETPDLRFVDGDRVNVRGGPGTDYAVVGKLFRNDMVEVLKDEGNGWLHLRATSTGEEGWIADWLVTAAN